MSISSFRRRGGDGLIGVDGEHRYFSEYLFIKVHENLEQHPSNNIFIFIGQKLPPPPPPVQTLSSLNIELNCCLPRCCLGVIKLSKILFVNFLRTSFIMSSFQDILATNRKNKNTNVR